MEGKLVICSAPSGAGKSTIISYLLAQGLRLCFSVSATSRPPRGSEQDGREYFFLSPEAFRQKIADGDFLEYEEVYAGLYYGTLRSEVERILSRGDHLILDVDVLGACRIKELYGDRALSLFIAPPDLGSLRNRLLLRGTDTPEVIAHRLERVAYELDFASRFDALVVNDLLEQAQAEALRIVQTFLHS